MSTLPAVVDCASGLRVAQRGAAPVVPPADLHVGPVVPVVAPAQQPEEAHRFDGVVWRRHWSSPARLVIDFVDLAVVEVDAAGVVTFDRPLPAEVEQHLLLDHVLPLVIARRGGLVVHGGVISCDGRGVVLVGSSGAGKSTLVAFAWQRGWTVGGDDGAVLGAGPPPTAQPTYSTVRLAGAGMALVGLPPSAGSPVVGKRRLTGEGDAAFLPAPVPLHLVAVVEPVAAGEGARFEAIAGIEAHAELFGSTFHAELASRRLLPTVVEELASIVETTAVGRLAVPRGVEGLAAAERVLRTRLDVAEPGDDAQGRGGGPRPTPGSP